jgi:hypothetical protein
LKLRFVEIGVINCKAIGNFLVFGDSGKIKSGALIDELGKRKIFRRRKLVNITNISAVSFCSINYLMRAIAESGGNGKIR